MKKLMMLLIVCVAFMGAAYTQDEDTATGPIFLPQGDLPAGVGPLFLTNDILVPVDPDLDIPDIWLPTPTVYAVDPDEAMPYYGPMGNLFCPLFVIGDVDGDGLGSVVGPYAFGDDSDHAEIFTPFVEYDFIPVETLLPCYAIKGQFSVKVDIDEAMPHYKKLGLFGVAVDIDEVMPHYVVLSPTVDIDEALPHYKPVGYLVIDPDEALPHYIVLKRCGPLVDIDEALPHYIVLSVTGKKVDIDEALPHYEKK